MKTTVRIFLLITSLFSIGVLLFHIGIIPPIFGKTNNAALKNEVMLNLSYSYLAGFIFYILISWLPNKTRTNKMRPFIDDKKTIIRGNFENCAYAIIPTSLLLDHIPTKTEIINHLENTSFLTALPYTSLLLPNTNIDTHWQLQRNEIKTHIQELLEFKEFLTDKELKTLGILQNCHFFSHISLISHLTDNPQNRKSIAMDLWDVIEIARKL